MTKEELDAKLKAQKEGTWDESKERLKKELEHFKLNSLNKGKNSVDYLINNKVLEPYIFLDTDTAMDSIIKLNKNAIHIIAATPKMGKSYCLCHIATNMAKKYRVLYISLENAEQLEQKRFKEAKEIYGISSFKSFDIICPIDIKTIEVLEMCKFGKYDAIFIDGTEFLLEGTSGAEMFAKGKDLLLSFRSCINKNENKPALIISWQNTRDSVKKTIDEVDASDLSATMAASQIPETIWTVKKWRNKEDGKLYHKMRCVVCRYESIEKDTIDIIDENSKHIYLGDKPITQEEFDNFNENYPL